MLNISKIIKILYKWEFFFFKILLNGDINKLVLKMKIYIIIVYLIGLG